MADEGYGRTFPNDPNAPAKPPTPPAVKTSSAPTAPAPEEGSGPAPSPAVEQSAPAGDVYRVASDAEGRSKVYKMGADLETKDLGQVSIKDADEVLHAVGAFNPVTQSWEVPQDAAMKLLGGRLPLPAYLEAKWIGGEAGSVRGLVGKAYLEGRMTAEDARARGNAELLKSQLNEAPIFAYQDGGFGPTVAKMWKDLNEAGASGVARRVAGEVAGAVPDLLSMFSDAAQSAAVFGAGGAAAGAPLGPGGAAAGGMAMGEVGFTYGLFKHAFDVSAGNTALDMLDKGFDPKTVATAAPLAGAINGVLMIGQVKFMTAALQRTFVKDVLASKTVKGALARYMTEVSAGTSMATAQKAVDIAVNDISAQVENRSDLMTPAPISDIVNATITAAPVMAAFGLPGAALEVKGAMGKPGETTPVKPGEPGKLVTAAQAEGGAPKPSEPQPKPAPATVDPRGDYFQTPGDKLQSAVDKADSGKSSPQELQAAVDELTGAKTEGGPRTYGEKVVEVERKAHVAALKEELAATETQMRALQLEQTRYEKAGMGTKAIERRIETLNTEATDIRGNIEFHTNIGPKDLMIEEKQRLSMAPSTLESAVNLGFTEGRKEVLDVRRAKILDVADRLDLTPAEVRDSMGARNYGTMSDAQFEHWFNGTERKGAEPTQGFVDKAKGLLRERIAREHVVETLKTREISGERNIRALHELPPIGKMTEKQLYDFADLLHTYEEGSRALAPKNIDALRTGPYKDARTYQDVLRLAAEKQKQPMEKLMGARRDQFDYLRGDVALAEKHPLFAAVVDPVQQARARAAATHEAWREVNVRLGAEALASRGNALSRFLDPTMPEVMAHLETDPALLYAGQVDPAKLPTLTTAETKYVDFLRSSFQNAREYLRLTKELETSRFENSYFPHVKRSLAEVIKSVKDSGVRKALGEMVDGMFNSQEKLTISDPQAFGYRKFFKQTVFRTGDLEPSKEVMRVADNYMRDFFDKQELDIAGPEALTLARSILMLETDKSPDAVKARGAVVQLIKDYLNNKKGINLTFERLAPRGGAIDAILRSTSSFISFSRIALNIPLELTAPIGENLAATQVTGHLGYAKAQARMFTAEGKAFLKNHEAFTEKGQIETLFEPGRNIEQRAATVMYGALQFGRTHALKSILLALATPEELAAGRMSTARLAEIERHTGRWVDTHGMKSIVGSTTPGAAYTKFRTWMLPIMRSTIQDLGAAADSLRGKKEMISQQKWELVNAGFNTTVAATALFMVQPDKKDKSAVANVRRKAVQELFSILQGANPAELLKPGPVVKFYEDLYNNLKLMYVLESDDSGGYHVGARYKKDTNQHQEGDLKGPPALARQAIPAMFRQFKAPEEDK